MYCVKCGKEIKDNAKFCVFCGAAVKAADEAVAPQNVLNTVQPFEESVETNTITILGAKAGEKYDDICISGI